MNYEQKYKAALGWMETLYNGLHGKTKEEAEKFFPELKESEDDRIRKTLIEIFTSVGKKEWRDIPTEKIIAWLEKLKVFTEHGDGLYYFVNNSFTYVSNPTLDNISWLEKQGKPAKLSEEEQNRIAKGILSSCAMSFINYLDAHKYEGKMCVSNGECEDIENAFHNAMWNRLHRYYCKYIEKQGERKPAWGEENERIRKSLICFLTNLLDQGGMMSEGWDSKECQEYIDWLEKQCEKKPVDKVEPKFKDSKYVVDDSGFLWNIDKVEPKFKVGDKIRRKTPSSYDKDMQVARIEEDYYICNHIGKFSSEVVPFSKESCYELVEQKYVYKVEPKFKVGDWVVFNPHESIYQIREIENFQYTLRHVLGGSMPLSFSHEDMIRPWTIEDANDGDVLLFEGYYNSIVLFQGIGINGKGRINYHCKCDLGNYSFGIQDDVACLGTIEQDAEHYHPATKEQRDILFRKMKETGYEWDAKNKELKKIETKGGE